MNNNLISGDLVGINSPHCRYSVVKIGFGGSYKYKKSDKENLKIQICIGTGIAKELNWKNCDKINIVFCDDYFLLNKIKDDEDKNSEYKVFRGHKLRKIKNTYSYRLSMTCNFITAPSEKGIRTVKHEIIEEEREKCLRVFFKLGSKYENN